MAKRTAKRLAVIDLGTNSVRFDIHEATLSGESKVLLRHKLMVRLGENLFISGKLHPRATQRTLKALARFKRQADRFEVNKLVAFATSAVRDASDGKSLIRKIRAKTGIRMQTISGKTEARLIAKGILKRELLPRGKFALVDIGGGSTEISVCEKNRVLVCQSFPLGVARLQQVFLHSLPPENGSRSVEELRSHIRLVLAPTRRWPRARHIIGSSGTARTLSRMCQGRSGKKISAAWLRKFVHRLTPLKLKQIRLLSGMEPQRADLILAGTVVLEECMRAVGAKSVSATEFSLREGILDQELRKL